MGERRGRTAIASTPRPRDRKAQIITAEGDLFFLRLGLSRALSAVDPHRTAQLRR